MIGLVQQGSAILLNAGDVFAGYTIDRLLGSGGMGEVYLAQHPRLPRREALKILNDNICADPAYRLRFIKEADLAAALWHPNIVRINDRGETDGQLWIAMDFVDGTDAATILREQYPAGMPADQVSVIVKAIAAALDYAHHQHGVLHRDVSPANILLAARGTGEQRILLSDFGIARNIADTGGLTATNMMIGTFPYAAPEQLTDEPIDGRADQYALAATAYHLLTGTTLFPHTNPAVVISRHLSAPPPKLADIRPPLEALDPIFAVALAKDPTDRFPRCSDFADAFTQTVDSVVGPTNSDRTMPRPKAVRTTPRATSAAWRTPRRRWRVVAAAATVLSLTGVAASGYQTDNTSQSAKPGASPVLAQPHPVVEHAVTPAPPEQLSVPQPADAAPSPAPAAATAPASAPHHAAVRAAASPTAAPAPPPKPTPPQPKPAPDPDQTFVSQLSTIPGLTVTDPGTAAATGRAICKSLQNGGSPNDSVQATVNGNNGLTPAQAAAGVNAAIGVYCPQYPH